MEQRIRQVLENIGLASLPESAGDSLADYGLDSLMIVLSVAGFEKEFSIKIPADKVDESSFATIASIQKLLVSLGAK